MDKDKKLRMEVFAEGRRAFITNAECPYDDWRIEMWQAGHDQAASEHALGKLYQESMLERKRSDMPDYTDAEKARAFDAMWNALGNMRGEFVRFKHVNLEPHRPPEMATYRRVYVKSFAIAVDGDVYNFKDVLHALATKGKLS